MTRRGFLVGVLIGIPIGILIYRLLQDNKLIVDRIPASRIPAKAREAVPEKERAIELDVAVDSSDPDQPDDLKKINGIGPKIAGLLNKAGIYTFQQLAEAKLDTLQAILEEAGPRFQLADPNDWAKQACDLALS